MKRFVLSLIALILTVNWAQARLVTPRSLVDLQRDADLIVVGTAMGSFPSSQVVNFSVDIKRVVKGDPSIAGQTIPVYWPSAAITVPLGTVRSAGGTGLWFFQHANSRWVLIPVLDGRPDLGQAYFPTSSDAILSAYAYTLGANLNDKLASEVASAIESTNGAYNFQLSLLQYGLLDQLKSPVTDVLYQRLSSSPVAQLKMLGLSGLIRGGNSSALVSATQSESVFATHPIENGILTQSIRVDFRAADANSVAALGAAAVSTNLNPLFREAAAHAMASIHTAATLPFLAELLGDPSVTLRGEAIGGLGAFANGLPIQTSADVASLAYLQLSGTSSPYRTADTIANFARGEKAISQNESKYLSFWSSWWSQNRAGLGL